MHKDYLLRLYGSNPHSYYTIGICTPNWWYTPNKLEVKRGWEMEKTYRWAGKRREQKRCTVWIMHYNTEWGQMLLSSCTAMIHVQVKCSLERHNSIAILVVLVAQRMFQSQRKKCNNDSTGKVEMKTCFAYSIWALFELHILTISMERTSTTTTGQPGRTLCWGLIQACSNKLGWWWWWWP